MLLKNMNTNVLMFVEDNDLYRVLGQEQETRSKFPAALVIQSG